MEQYVKKSALVAEIERRIQFFTEESGNSNSDIVIALFGLKSFIDTFEVKKVDLEEDINDFINEEYHYTEYDGKWVDEKDWRDSIQRCAKHFFELGMAASNKTQKREEV